MKKATRKGFTIVELLVVIAVIAVLAAVLIPVMVYLIDDAKVSADEQTVASLNKAIAAETGDMDTASDALEAAEDVGYGVDKLTPTSDGNLIVWDQETKYFALVSEDGEEVYSNGELSGTAALWAFAQSEEDAESLKATFSVYLAYETEEDASITSENGVDVGENEDVDVTISDGASDDADAGSVALAQRAIVAYADSEDGNYAILVNANGGEITVDRSGAEVSVYGSANTLTATAGSITLTASCSVPMIVVTSTDVTVVVNSASGSLAVAETSSISIDSLVSGTVTVSEIAADSLGFYTVDADGEYASYEGDADTFKAAVEALEDGAAVYVASDIDLTVWADEDAAGEDARVFIQSDITIDLGGNTITSKGSIYIGERIVYLWEYYGWDNYDACYDYYYESNYAKYIDNGYSEDDATYYATYYAEFYAGYTVDNASTYNTATVKNGTFYAPSASEVLRVSEGASAAFENISFEAADPSYEVIQTWMGGDAYGETTVLTFTGCSFYGTVYLGASSSATCGYDVTFTDCDFTATAGTRAAAVETYTLSYGTVLFDNCTITVTQTGNDVGGVLVNTSSSVNGIMKVTLKDTDITVTCTADMTAGYPVYVADSDYCKVSIEGTCNLTCVAYDGTSTAYTSWDSTNGWS